MLIDPFDKKKYSTTRSFESKIDYGEKNFKSILQKNSENNNINSALQHCRNIEPNKVHIGKISGDIPTVSELLYKTPQYKNKCWDMLENDVNSSKHFKKIPSGTDIYLDKETSEIVWGKEHSGSSLTKGNKNLRVSKKLPKTTHNDFDTKSIIRGSDFFDKKAEPAFYKSNSINSNNINSNPENRTYKSLLQNKPSQNKPALNEAVREFMGKDYSKIDCYELVVNGLKNMGVKYSGKDGLGRHLIDKAIDEGLSENHYLTGEGLVEATGQSVYNKTILNVRTPISQAQSAMNEMENVLKEGQILSFSTHSRGHTGVISRKNGVWTFINSGYMDNNIAGKNGKKQVGEEILSKELENWFKLAGKRKESLQITLGNIDVSKIAAYREDRRRVSEKA
ncbi:MAG: hypothetical protein HQK72_06395 [Desulfamplus sp.]|nr:hypothetical protein [Desulfamplus sp.]